MHYLVVVDGLEPGRRIPVRAAATITIGRAAPAEERDFFQGLVHVAVAWYQAGRGRKIGTERQLAKALRRLEPFAPTHRGIELEPLLTQLRELHELGSLNLPPPRL